MKKFFSLIAAVLFAGSMMAETVTLTMADFADVSFSDQTSGISVSTAKNAGQTAPAYNATGKDLRVYAKGSITIEAAKNITSISFTISSQGKKRLAPLTASVGSVVVAGDPDFTAEWTGSATSVTLTVGDVASYGTESTKAGQLCFTAIVVTLAGEVPPTPSVATPVISGEAEFTESTLVSISCETLGAAIYYTLNGADPTTNSLPYDEPFTLTETATVKAVAYDIENNQYSAIASKTFTKKEPLVAISCAEVYNKAKGDELALNNVVVAYANGKNVYVQDETGYMLLYLVGNTTWEAGNILSGVEGTLDIYNGLYEVKMTAAQATAVQPGQGEAPSPIEFTAAPVAADMNKYIVLKNVTVSAETFPSNKNMDCTIGEESFVLRNNFNANAAFDITKKYDIIGVVAVYNSTVQVYFISAEEVQATAIDNNTVADKVQKVVRDGQLYIIRDGKMINVLGAQL